MDFDELIASIEIFKKYRGRGYYQDGFHAEHHEILSGLAIEETEPEDAKRLEELGWYEDEFTGESWAHYARM